MVCIPYDLGFEMILLEFRCWWPQKIHQKQLCLVFCTDVSLGHMDCLHPVHQIRHHPCSASVGTAAWEGGGGSPR